MSDEVELRLVIVDGGRTLDAFELGDPERVVIGRHEKCEVRLDREGVSRRHCEIVKEGGAHLLRDLGSSNGTYVRGRRVSSHALNPGDTFSVCGLVLRYEADLPRAIAAHGAEETVPDVTFRIDPAAEARKLKGAVAARVRGHLLIPTPIGEQNLVLQEAVLTIGADPDADIALHGRFFVPRLAALILREDQGYRCLDVSPRGSSVKVNGLPAPEAVLEHGDALEVCRLKLRYQRGLPRFEEGPA